VTGIAQVQIRDRSGESCVEQNGFCPEWIWDNLDRYVDPFFQQAYLVVVSVAIGFVIAFCLALLAHRRGWLVGPIIGITGILYTLPSLAVFFLLQPITGRGNTTAIVALVAYTLLIIFRNVMTGFANVPEESKDAARGMGMTDRQVLWRVEVPLALPEIMTGLRVASTTTVGLATLAFFAGAGGLGEAIFADITFKSNVVVAGALCVLLAVILEVLIATAERLMTPWRRADRGGGGRRPWRRRSPTPTPLGDTQRVGA
jgi:osmoprotectant transport system permease protein